MSATHPTNACANVRCDYVDIATLYGGDSDVPSPAKDEPWGPQPIRDANARLTAAAPALRDTVAALADLADAQAQEIERLRYVLKGVRGTIDTGRNEPLTIWREQISIALGETP